MDISTMTQEQKTLLLKITKAIIKDFNNDMVDHWTKENYRISDECRKTIDALEKEYNEKFGNIPSWPYISDVVSAKEVLERNLSD